MSSDGRCNLLEDSLFFFIDIKHLGGLHFFSFFSVGPSTRVRDPAREPLEAVSPDSAVGFGQSRETIRPRIGALTASPSSGYDLPRS